MTNEIVSMLKEKLQDWFQNLSDEEKQKYDGLGLDVNFLVDQLMGVGINKSSLKSDKKKLTGDSKETKEQDSKESNKKLMHFLDEEEEAEIQADEEVSEN